jgi:hypothetical protein
MQPAYLSQALLGDDSFGSMTSLILAHSIQSDILSVNKKKLP